MVVGRLLFPIGKVTFQGLREGISMKIYQIFKARVFFCWQPTTLMEFYVVTRRFQFLSWGWRQVTQQKRSQQNKHEPFPMDSGQISIIPKPELREFLGGIPLLNHHFRWPRRFGRYNLPRWIHPKWVFPKNMGKPPKSSRVWNHYFHHPFWVMGSPIFASTPKICFGFNSYLYQTLENRSADGRNTGSQVIELSRAMMTIDSQWKNGAIIRLKNKRVGGWTNPYEKIWIRQIGSIWSSNWIISPIFGVNIKKSLSCHHPDI